MLFLWFLFNFRIFRIFTRVLFWRFNLFVSLLLFLSIFLWFLRGLWRFCCFIIFFRINNFNSLSICLFRFLLFNSGLWFLNVFNLFLLFFFIIISFWSGNLRLFLIFYGIFNYFWWLIIFDFRLTSFSFIHRYFALFSIWCICSGFSGWLGLFRCIFNLLNFDRFCVCRFFITRNVFIFLLFIGCALYECCQREEKNEN